MAHNSHCGFIIYLFFFLAQQFMKTQMDAIRNE